MHLTVLILLATVATLLCGSLAAAQTQTTFTDPRGRIESVSLDGQLLEIASDLRVHKPGWTESVNLGRSRGTKVQRRADGETWTGRLPLGERPEGLARDAAGPGFAFEQVITERGNASHIRLRVTCDTDDPIEAVVWGLTVPVRRFAGGRVELTSGGAGAAQAVLPVELPQVDNHFAAAQADGARLLAPGGKPAIALSFASPQQITLQDARKWDSQQYELYVTLAGNQFKRGQSAELDVTIAAVDLVDHTPATLSIDATRPAGSFIGFGGNYCFALNSPVAMETLKRLDVGYGRIEMKLAEWEPTNDNDSPDKTDVERLSAHDTDTSDIRRSMLIGQELNRRGIPFVISIWRLPEWMTRTEEKHHIQADEWPEVLEGIGSYLLYAKQKYGLEPVAFSFNEPDMGVNVLVPPEEHAEYLKRVGAHLESLGLKTKVYLGDNGSPRNPDYIDLAMADPQAMRYAGAVSFHSWFGAEPDVYRQWRAKADALQLPLHVVEAGWDAMWQNVAIWLHTYHYALRELRLYQELLTYARPQATMQWELTSDYSVLDIIDDGKGGYRVEPTHRFHFLRHFFNLSPKNSLHVPATSDRDSLMITALHRPESKDLAIHIANLGASRSATISGIPAGIESLRVITTGETEKFRAQRAAPVRKGQAVVELPSRSMVTLTTLQEPAEH
jgi:hypothetical protein